MIVRTTLWAEGADWVQASVYVLDSTTWEELCGVTKRIGPFDDADELVAAMVRDTVAYATKQIPGQLAAF